MFLYSLVVSVAFALLGQAEATSDDIGSMAVAPRWALLWINVICPHSHSVPDPQTGAHAGPERAGAYRTQRERI